jgi:uncharacterized membrane protein
MVVALLVISLGIGILLFLYLQSRLMRLHEQLELLNHEVNHRLLDLERKIANTDHLPAREDPFTADSNTVEAIPADSNTADSNAVDANAVDANTHAQLEQHNPFLVVSQQIAPAQLASEGKLSAEMSGLGLDSSQTHQPEPKSGVQHQTESSSVSGFSQLLQSVQQYFKTGNTIVKSGVVLIFFGISFLLKYVTDQGLLPVETRLIASALLGVGLVRLGWTTARKFRDYGLVLQGGGVGVLLLTTFVSVKTYALITPVFAFLLLIGFTVVTGILAVYQNSINLAVFGFLGGFLAPILVSSGGGQHVVLFGYYALLNLGILYVSYKKTWRALNLLGFIGTFALASAWGVLKYQAELYGSTQPFLILYFLIYVAIPIIFARKKPPELHGYVDGTIVFGNSAMTLFLQLELVRGIEYGGAFSALGLACFYTFLSKYLLSRRNPNYMILAEAFIAVGIVLLTLVVPLAFDGLQTAAIWALEGAGVYWFALRQNRTVARRFGVFLVFASAVAFYVGPERGISELLFVNKLFLSCLLITCGFYVTSFLTDRYNKDHSNIHQMLSVAAFTGGSMWWILGGLYEIHAFASGSFLAQNTPDEWRLLYVRSLPNIDCLYLTLGVALLSIGARGFSWLRLRYLTHGFVFVLLVCFFRDVTFLDHPFAGFGYVSWVLALVVYYVVLYDNDRVLDINKHFLLRFGHAGALWVVVGVAGCELCWLAYFYIDHFSSWGVAAQAIAPVFAAWLVMLNGNVLKWPVKRHGVTYLGLGLAPIIATSWCWLMVTNVLSHGNAAPLRYVPFMNPLEVAQAGVLLVVGLWVFRMRQIEWFRHYISRRIQTLFIGGSIFIWLNGVLCRSLHHFLDIPFNVESLMSSVEVQVAFSLFWTVLGLTMMIVATKKIQRWLWVSGAVLLGIVVLKMLVIDLSKSQTIARVISFLGVGALFLIVGYVAPMPPNTGDREVKREGS